MSKAQELRSRPATHPGKRLHGFSADLIGIAALAPWLPKKFPSSNRTSGNEHPLGGSMKRKALAISIAITLFAALAIPVQALAQEQKEARKHHHYRLVDIGTFGGPNSFLPEPTQSIRPLNNRGMLASGADTAIPDPNAQNNNGF